LPKLKIQPKTAIYGNSRHIGAAKLRSAVIGQVFAMNINFRLAANVMASLTGNQGENKW
jgi:hypothetical protein